MKNLILIGCLILCFSGFGQNEQERIEKLEKQIELAVEHEHYERAAEIKKEIRILEQIILSNESEDFAEVARLKVQLSNMRTKNRERIAFLQADRDSAIFRKDYSTAKEIQWLLEALTAGSFDVEEIEEIDSSELVVILPLDSFKVKHHREYVLFEYRINKDTVRKSPTLHYYGFDMSRMVLVDSTRAAQDEDLNGTKRKWAARFEANVIPNTHIKEWLRANYVFDEKNYLQDHYADSIPPNWIWQTETEWTPEEEIKKRSDIQYYNPPGTNWLSIEDIDRFVKEYEPRVADGTGPALVVIPETFIAETKMVRANFVFFDIRTHELLWVTKIEAKAFGPGFVGMWANGLAEVFKRYGSEVHTRF